MLIPFLALPLLIPQGEESSVKSEDLVAVINQAQKEDKRVLLRFQSKLCADSQILSKLIKRRKVAKVLGDEYVQLGIEVGALNQNMNIAEAFDAPLVEVGTPYLVVLNFGEIIAAATASQLKNEKTGVLDRGKFLAFLKEHRVPPPVALDVLEEARARAAKQGKNLFVHIGAPW